MADRDSGPRLTLAEAAGFVGGRVEGDATISFERLAPIHAASAGDLALLADRRYASHVESCAASAFLVSEALESLVEGVGPRIVVPDAMTALQALLSSMYPSPDPPRGVDGGAHVGDGVSLDDSVRVEAGAVIGAGATLGAARSGS